MLKNLPVVPVVFHDQVNQMCSEKSDFSMTPTL